MVEIALDELCDSSENLYKHGTLMAFAF